MYSLMNKSKYNRFDYEFESIDELKDFVINTATDCFGMFITKDGVNTGKGLMRHMKRGEIGQLYRNIRDLRNFANGIGEVPEFMEKKNRSKVSKTFYHKEEEKKKRFSIFNYIFKR